MKDIITISLNTAELCILAIALLSVGAGVWLVVRGYITDSRMRLLTEINDDLERLHNNTKADKVLNKGDSEVYIRGRGWY